MRIAFLISRIADRGGRVGLILGRRHRFVAKAWPNFSDPRRLDEMVISIDGP